MGSLSDAIEGYIRGLLEDAPGHAVEVRRAELADKLGCVPSQITYVLMTRFTPQRGFLVESRRGGGGFIRIRRLGPPSLAEVVQALDEVGEGLSEADAEGLVQRLEEGQAVSAREAAMMRAALRRNTLAVALPERDFLRARILRAMLVALLGS